MGKIDDLFRKYTVIVNNGSGCLFQPDISRLPVGEKKFTYVLTAKHTIQDKDRTIFFKLEKIKVYRGNDQKPENQLIVLDFFPHEDDEKDAVILKVEYVDDNINLYHTSLDLDNPDNQEIRLRFFGYPARRRKRNIKTAGVNCTVDMEHENGMIEIVPNKTQFGYDRNALENIKGFSGCGVFKKLKGNILLVGILSQLADPSGAGDNLLILPMHYFNKIISQNDSLPILIPKHLTSFEGYKNDICKGYGVKLTTAKIIMERFADLVIGRKITPMLIIKQFQGKLCVPNNTDWLNDRALWSGWFELLTYMALMEEDDKSDELNALDKLLKNKCIFYNNNEEDWYRFLRLILEENPEGFKKVKYVITLQNSKDIQLETKVRSKAIIPQIAQPSMYIGESGINIAGGRKPNDYLFIHSQEFKNKIRDNRGNLTGAIPEDEDRITQELKNCIERAFSDG
jgi:hypothetical protein